MKKSNSGVRILFLATILIMIALLPAFGEIVSVRTRRYASRDFGAGDFNVDQFRYAKITAGDLLSKRMIGVTIQNDPTPTFALMKISIDIESENLDWDGTSIVVSLTAELAANQLYSFDNTQIVTNFGTFQYVAAESDVGSIPFDINDPIGSISGLALPDGTVTITIAVYQVDSLDAPIPGGLPLNEIENEFKVAAIAPMVIEKLPTAYSDQVIRWQLPEIPYYGAGSTTRSTVRITGGAIDRTITLNHAAPSGSALTGYPQGSGIIADGLASYDLGPLALQFRLGQVYQVEIVFTDWNSAEIDRRTGSFRFSGSVPAPALISPSGTIQTLQPTFSWNLGQYYEWAAAYDLYVNGTLYRSGISEDSFDTAIPLQHGTSYSWYVIPRYADGTAFFTSPPGSVGFTTPAHDRFEVSLVTPAAGNAVLFAGTTYPLEAEVELYDEATLALAEWRIGAVRLTGLQAVFTPSARGSSAASLRAADSFTLERTLPIGTFTVKDPRLTIRASGPAEVYAGTAGTFSTATRQDVDRIDWLVNGTVRQSGTGTSFTFTPSTAGEVYQVTAIGYTTGMNGSWTLEERPTAETDPIQVQAYSRLPAALTLSGPGPRPIPSSEPAEFSIATDLPAALSGAVISWKVDGAAVSGTGETLVVSNLSPGTRTISATITDSFGNTTSGTIQVQVFGTVGVRITSPVQNAMLAQAGIIPVTAAVTIGGISPASPLFPQIVTSISWYLDDGAAPAATGASASVNIPRPGNHRLRLEAVTLTGDILTDEVEFEIAFDFVMRLASSPSGITSLRTFESLDFDAVIQFLPGSPVSVSDLDEDEFTWYVNGSAVGSGLSYTFSEGPGTYRILNRYERNGNVKSTTERTVTVREPNVPAILSPAPGQLVFGPGRSINLSASGEPDADYLWELVSPGGTIPLARGKSASVPTADLSGISQALLRLTTSIGPWEETVSQEHPVVYLAPFTASLTAPQRVLAGSTVTAEAGATGLNDGGSAGITASYTFYLDGVLIRAAGANPSVEFMAPPGGAHTLKVAVSDNFGRREEASLPFQSVTPQIVSITGRAADFELVVGSAETFSAALSPTVSPANPGTYQWSLTGPAGISVQEEGSTFSHIFAQTGNYLLEVAFTSSEGLFETAREVVIAVVPVPELSVLLNTARSIYNPGDTVTVRAVMGDGFNPENAVYQWSRNGAPVFGSNAPEFQFTAGAAGSVEQIGLTVIDNRGTTGSAELQFPVNSPPYGFSIAVLPGLTHHLTGTTITFSASGALDPEGHLPISYQWFSRSGGSVQPLSQPRATSGATAQFAPGTYEIFVSVTDSLGLSSSSEPLVITVYPSVAHIEPVVNNGNPDYLTTQPLPMTTALPSGDGIAAEWVVSQGDYQVNLTGAVAELPDGSGLTEGPFTVTGILKSGDFEVKRTTRSLTAFSTVIADITSPENGSRLQTADTITVGITLTGFSRPTFTYEIDSGAAAASGTPVLLPSEGSSIRYQIPLQSPAFLVPGLHTIGITVSDPVSTSELVLTVNLVETLAVMTIVDPPQLLDRRNPEAAGWRASVEISNTPYEQIVWESSRHTQPIGTGLEVPLYDVLTAPGEYTIHAKALSSEGAVLISDSFSVTVLGEMQLTSTPDITEGVYSDTSDAAVTVTVTARDGSAVPEENISWTSSESGPAAAGSTLVPGTDLPPGEHIVTLIAADPLSDAEYLTRAYNLTVTASSSAEPDEDDEDEEEGFTEDDDILDLNLLLAPEPVSVSVVISYRGSASFTDEEGNPADAARIGRFVYDNERIVLPAGDSRMVVVNTGRGVAERQSVLTGANTYVWDDQLLGWIVE